MLLHALWAQTMYDILRTLLAVCQNDWVWFGGATVDDLKKNPFTTDLWLAVIEFHSVSACMLTLVQFVL